MITSKSPRIRNQLLLKHSINPTLLYYHKALNKQMFSITDFCDVYFEVLFAFEEFSILQFEIVIHIYRALNRKYPVPFEPLGLL